MTQPAQNRAIKRYRDRLNRRGLVRFEVVAPENDKTLIRALARQLSEDSPDAVRVRSTVSQTVGSEPPKKGGILAALRRSPLVGAGVKLRRPLTRGRTVDL